MIAVRSFLKELLVIKEIMLLRFMGMFVDAWGLIFSVEEDNL